MLVQRNSTSIEHRVGFAEQLRKFPHWSDASAYLCMLGKFFTHRVSAGWLELHSASRKMEYALPVVAYVLNVAFYSAYDKKSGSLSLSLLEDIFLFRKQPSPLQHFLIENNKVLALVGLTLIAAAFLPLETLGLSHLRSPWLKSALLTQILHAAFSTLKWYGDRKKVPTVQTWPKMLSEMTAAKPKVRLEGRIKLSVFVGLIGFLALIELVYDSVDSQPLGLLCLLTTVLHFLTMETDHKLNLNVRPFGLLPLPLSAIAIISIIYNMLVGDF